MALRNLSLAEMVGVSAAWIAPAGHRAAFEGVPALAALLPEIERAHEGLVRAESPGATGPIAEKLAKIVADALIFDSVHDQSARGGYKMLDAWIELSGSESPEGVRYRAMRDAVYPEGTSFTGQSYVAESGHAMKTQQALEKSPELRAELRDIELFDKRTGKKRTLLEVVKAQIKAGRELGELEAKRTELLQATPDTVAQKDAPLTLSEGRNRWMSVTGDVVRMAKYASPKDRKLVESALLHLQRVEKAADARAARRSEAPAEATPSEPTATAEGDADADA